MGATTADKSHFGNVDKTELKFRKKILAYFTYRRRGDLT